MLSLSIVGSLERGDKVEIAQRTLESSFQMSLELSECHVIARGRGRVVVH